MNRARGEWEQSTNRSTEEGLWMTFAVPGLAHRIDSDTGVHLDTSSGCDTMERG